MSGLVVRDLATGAASRLKPNQRLVALCLAYFMRKERECFPSVPVIAAWTGLSQASVKRALGVLTGESGFLEKATRPGRYSSNVYRLREGAHLELPQGAQAEPSQGEGAHGEPQGAQGEREGAHSEPVMKAGSEYREARAQTAHSEPSRLEAPKPSTPARTVLRSEWQELIGAPSRFFDGDVLPLVTQRRPLARVVESMRAYAASVDLSRASSREFAQGVEGWPLKAKPKASEPEAYTGSDEQRRAKAARYGITL